MPARTAGAQPMSANELLFLPYAKNFTDPFDAIVRVQTPTFDCSGTLIAPDLVLTARHCVVIERDGLIRAPPLPPEKLVIGVGGGYAPWGTANVRAVVVPEACHGDVIFGDHDLAVLVLAKPITAVKPIRAAVFDSPYAGQRVSPSGFGSCTPSQWFVSHRQMSPIGEITRLFSDKMLLDSIACPGDSGGPALDAVTGEVVGVISRGAGWGQPDLLEVRARPHAIATRLDAYRSVIVKAEAIAAGAAPDAVAADCIEVEEMK